MTQLDEKTCDALYGAWQQWRGCGRGTQTLKKSLSGRGMSAAAIRRDSFKYMKNEFQYTRFEVDGAEVWFPDVTTSEILDKKAPVGDRYWNKQGWFTPAYLQRKFLDDLREADDFEAELSTVYGPFHTATMWNQGFRDLEIFSEFLPIVFESLEAFYQGLHHVAVSSAVPVVEGTLRELLDRLGYRWGDSNWNARRRMRSAVAESRSESIYNCDWLPSEFCEFEYLKKVDEFVLMVDGYLQFLGDNLFKKTANYSDPKQLNRHGIAHGLFRSFGSEANYVLIFSMLEMHAFITNLTGESEFLLFPTINRQSNLIGAYLQGLKHLSGLRKAVSETVRTSAEVNSE